MRKVLAVGIMGLLPLSVLADVSINFSISPRVVREVEYVDYGDPWFDEDRCEGKYNTSVEYQWSQRGSDYVLRYRKVSFNNIGFVWHFGDWIVKEVHHKPVHIRHASHPDWRRVYDHRTRSYHYEHKSHNHGKKTVVYRHTPHHSPVKNVPVVKHGRKPEHHPHSNKPMVKNGKKPNRNKQNYRPKYDEYSHNNHGKQVRKNSDNSNKKGIVKPLKSRTSQRQMAHMSK